jgi:hypothetical protein
MLPPQLTGERGGLRGQGIEPDAERAHHLAEVVLSREVRTDLRPNDIAYEKGPGAVGSPQRLSRALTVLRVCTENVQEN